MPSSQLRAHGGRLPFLFWGDFPRVHLACQRAIGRAVAQCAVGTQRLYALCAAGSASGDLCAPLPRAEALESLRAVALNVIDRHCSERSTVQLGFLALVEAQADISRACSQLDRWVRGWSADPTAVPGAQGACMETYARASLVLLRFATNEYRRLFDWLAFHRSPPNQRNQLLAERRARVGDAARRLELVLQRRCPDGLPGGPNPATFLSEVARQAECVVGAAYVQDALHCDTPTSAQAPPAAPASSVDRETLGQND